MKFTGKGLVFFGIGFELVALCLGGYYIGKIIDQHMGWKAWGTAGLILIMLVGWFYHLFILIKRFEKDDSDAGSAP